MSAARLVDLSTRIAAIGDGSGLRDDELVAVVRDIGELKRLVEAAGAQVAATLASRCAVKEPTSPDVKRGFKNVQTLIAAEATLEPRDAHAWTRVGAASTGRVALSGELLPAVHPVVAEAVSSGVITLQVADRIIRTLDDAAPHTSPDRIAELEATLVGAAPTLSFAELKRACQHVRDWIDPDGIEPRDDELRTRITLTVCQQEDGLTRITALLHPEGAAYVLTALDARTAPRRSVTFTEDGLSPAGELEEERRTLARRRADALIGIARDSLTLDTGQVAGAPVTVMVTMTLDQLHGAGGAARIIGLDQPIPASTARRTAASAGIIPLILGSASEILDQGREQRLATPAQRRALAYRDQGCIWGCGSPPGWCEVAHRTPWANGAPTDLDHLALMCPFHHWLYDHEHWTLETHDGQRCLIPPAHVDATRTPRRAGPPPLVA